MGLLADAEKALRDLMQRELQSQRYSELAELARMADAIARVLRGDGPAPTAANAPGSGQLTPKPPPKKANSPAPKPTVKPTASKGHYPRFERDGDKLVKIGWSKKNREAYEHRAPREAVIAFVRHLARSVAEGHVFAVDDLIPVPDASGGALPAYQVYLTLAWLRHAGAVEKKGRSGYVLRNGSFENGHIDPIWNEIPHYKT